MIIRDVSVEIDPNYPYVLYFIHNILIHRLCRRFIVNLKTTQYINSFAYFSLVIYCLDTVCFLLNDQIYGFNRPLFVYKTAPRVVDITYNPHQHSKVLEIFVLYRFQPKSRICPRLQPEHWLFSNYYFSTE